jgi:C_GCAxxG_C_C family probable redox protein
MNDAVKKFKEGCNCSQAVFTEFCGRYGVDEKLGLAAACGFGAGMGKMGKTCGAVTGAMMVLGLDNFKGNDSKPGVYEAVRKFVKDFEGRHGSIECRQLLGLDVSNPEEFKKASDMKLFETKCRFYVETASELLGAGLKGVKK